MTVNRRLFFSSKDHIGLTPYNAQPGDKICILFGSLFPIVLRMADTDRYWLFAGEAYVHGIVDGEADDPMMDSEDEVNGDEIFACS